MGSGIGIGYSELKIDGHGAGRSCPIALSRDLVAVGGVRLDAREDLIGALGSCASANPRTGSDIELVALAYRRWGEDCPAHLAGDFSFAVWDRKAQTLFCARDPFGVRPFYYGRFSDTLVFGNTLSCLLLFEDLAGKLDESAIGDFLLFGHVKRPERTPFSGIRRLAPAHCMTWQGQGGMRQRRYWSLAPPPIDRRLKANDILKLFEHRMRIAVADRLPGSGAVVAMSGGLDSTCVAAFAKEIAEASETAADICACTFDYRRKSPDREAPFARAAADALHIPIHLIDCDGDRLEWSTENSRGFYPEPFADTPTSQSYRRYLALLKRYRVGLTGEGGDPALHPRPRHAGRFFRHLLLGGLTAAAVRYRRQTGRFPRMGIRSSIRGWLGRPDGPPVVMPPWLAPDFARRWDLTGRFFERSVSREPAPCLRSEAHRLVTQPLWPILFEREDPGATGIPAQIRHPFFDLRVIRFLLSLPPVPWCVDKGLLRQALAPRLPAKIVQRPKTPLPGHPLYEMIRSAPQPLPVEKMLADSGLSRFVNLRRYLQILQNPDRIRPEEHELISRPLGLAWWLLQPTPGRAGSCNAGADHGKRTSEKPKTILS